MHLWLLHFLFIPRINEDIDAWIGAWNMHTLSSQTHTYRTPTDMFRQGMLEHGFRGVYDPIALEPAQQGAGSDNDYAAYGTKSHMKEFA